MNIARLFRLPVATLISCLLLAATATAADSPALPAPLNDGPYVLGQGPQRHAAWVCNDHVVRTPLPDTGAPATVVPRCGYPHTLQVEAAATPAVATLPATRRIVALSDIHGQYALMVKLLRAHGVIDAHDRWALGDATLVVAGDVVDRGEQVTEVFWLLYALQQQATEAGGAVHFVLGNHETMVLYDDLRYVNPKYLRVADALQRPYPELLGAESVIGQWLRSRPVLLRIGETLFLHGGIGPDALALALDAEATNARYRASLGAPKAEVKADPATAPLYDGKTSPIWYRGYFDGRLDTPAVEALVDRLGLARIVVGHTSMAHVSRFHNGRVIAIDSSIKNGDSGELLFIEDGQLSRGLLDGRRVPLAEGTVSPNH